MRLKKHVRQAEREAKPAILSLGVGWRDLSHIPLNSFPAPSTAYRLISHSIKLVFMKVYKSRRVREDEEMVK